MRQDIATFRARYVDYLNRTLPTVISGGTIPYDAEKQAIQRLAVRASTAVDASGVTLALSAPRVFQPSPILTGVATIVFAHEDKRYGVGHVPITGGHYKAPYELVIESLDSADAILEMRAQDLRKKRRNPLYWADRILRAILGFPAYLISLIGGFDRRQLSEQRTRFLWLVSLAADVATLYGFGRLVGWW
jgi:hypothetical protein